MVERGGEHSLIANDSLANCVRPNFFVVVFFCSEGFVVGWGIKNFITNNLLANCVRPNFLWLLYFVRGLSWLGGRTQFNS